MIELSLLTSMKLTLGSIQYFLGGLNREGAPNKLLGLERSLIGDEALN